MTLPLFGDTPARRHGPVRRALDAKITAAGGVVDDDLAIVARSLADRIDAANAAGERRGFVLLTGEYRQARAELFAEVSHAAGPDPFTAALDAFRDAAAHDAAGSDPPR